MQRLKFDLQRFATQEISAGDTYTQNGLIYTAITDAVLNLDDDGKISGLESGKVQSTLINSENSPTITFDASDDEIKFSATENDALAVTLSGRTFYFTEGTATVTSDKVSTGATKFSIAGTHSNADYKFTVEDSAEFSITTEAFVISSEKFYVSVLIGGNTLEFGVSGTATRNFTNHTFSFSGGTTISNTFGDYTFSATANDDSGGGFSFTSKGITFTPENGGTLGISIAQGDTPIFAREFSVNGGSIFVNHANQTIGLTDGAEISLASGDYEIIAKANGDASTIFSFAGNGFTFTPQENDGSLDITIKRGDDIIFGSTVGVSGGSVTIAPSDNAQVQKIAETNEVEKISVTAGTTISLSRDDSTLKLTAKDDSAVYAWRTDKNIFYFRLDGDSADFDVALMRGDNQIVQGELTFGGTLSYSAQYGTFALINDQKLSGDSFASLKIGDYTINAATPDKTFIFGMTMQDDGKIFVSYPSEGYNAINLSIQHGDTTIFDGKVSITGEMILDQQTQSISLEKGTSFTFTQNDYTATITATDDATTAISIGTDGITFTPQTGDGNLEISVTKNGETRTASIEMTGSVTYKPDGTISWTEGTVIKSFFDDESSLTITANKNADAKIIFSPQDGLTITPSISDALSVLMSAEGTDIIKLAEIDGTVTYSGGTFTASDGTEIRFVDPAGIYNDNVLRTAGGSTSLNFNTSRLIYTANEGATFTMDYLQGTTWNLQNGSITDYFSGAIQGLLSLSKGSTFDTNDSEYPFTLEKEGTYMINGIKVITSSDDVQVHVIDDDTISFADDAAVKISSDGNAFMLTGIDDAIQVKVIDNAEVTSGSITYDNATKKVTIDKGTTVSVTQGDQVIKLTAPKTISATYKVDDGISYFDLDSDATAKVSVTSGGQTVFAGDLTAGGVLSYNPASGTFGLTGANSSHGNGTNTFAQLNVNGYEVKMATNDTTVVFVPTITDGRLDINFPNERKHEMLFTLSKDGNTILEDQAIINGTVGFDIASKELHFTKGTVLTLGSGDRVLEITALEDAGGQLTFTDSGIRFAPNAGDGQLELNFVASDRKANIDVSSGALILNSDRTLSLEKGTVVNLTWEDGTKLTLTATDDGGSIGFDSQGLKVSSDGELSIDLTAGDVQTTLTGLKGTIHYNAGKVLFDKDSTLTATSTLGGQPVNITLESNGTGGYLEISAVGTNYVAGTGALAITWSRGDKSSTFSVSNGSVYIGHGIFNVAEGTNLSTDLKDLVPALYFTTTDAGTYTINGQTITTSAANLALTATDDQMIFHTSDDNVVECDGMIFAGDGNVSLSPASVILGAGVEATGFGEKNSFVLSEEGTVSADNKIFELLEDATTNISVIGAQDGFIFSHALSEAEIEINPGFTSSDLGKIFSEKFIAKNDDSYRVQTFSRGLLNVIGISDGASISASAALDETDKPTAFGIITDTTGEFTIGEKTFDISGDTAVSISALFDDSSLTSWKFDYLSGTVSGDFSGGLFGVNGSGALEIFGDTNVSISGDDNGFELFGLDENASLQVFSAGNYVVNGQNLSAAAGDMIIGLDDGNDAYVFDENNQLITKNTPNEKIIDIFNPENVSIVGANDGGKFEISLTGGDLAIVENTAAHVSISAGDDTVVSQGRNVQLSLTGGENTWMFPLGGKMSIYNYDFATGSGFGVIYKDIYSAIEKGSISFANGEISIGSGVVEFDIRSPLVNFFDRTSTRQIVGFAARYDSIDASNMDDNLIFVTENYSSIIGGAGNDSVFAAQSSFVDAGAGNNLIELKNSALRDSLHAGTTINISNGNNTIENFRAGFGSDSDILFFGNGDDTVDIIFDGEDLTVTGRRGGNATLENVSDGDDFVEILIGEDAATTKVAVLKENSIAKIDKLSARVFDGKNSGVDFSGVKDNMFIQLSASVDVKTDSPLLFSDVNYVVAGDGQTTVIGSENDETLIGGTGISSLWSNAGDDLMIGSSGTTKFFFDTNDGRDTVKSFNFDNDAINIFGNKVTDVKSDSAGNVIVQINDSDDYLTIENATDKNFRFNDLIANVAENVRYNDEATQFVATASNATLTVDDVAEIWLDNSHGKFYDGDIRTLDASAAEGRTSLVGNAFNNTIIAGKGDSSLWGGEFASDDLLIGGAGKNTFFYHLGNGNDTIQGAKFGDIVDLNTLTIDQVVGEIGDGFVVLKFIDGGSLTVAGTEVEFRINNDGTTYLVDNGEWKIK